MLGGEERRREVERCDRRRTADVRSFGHILQQLSQLGGGGGGGGGSAFQKMNVRTGAAFLTVETCQKALVLLQPTAITAERVTLAQHVQVVLCSP